VKEFPLVLECRLLHVVEIGLHTQFIGEILDVKAEDSVLGASGMPDIEKVKPFAYDPSSQTYVRVGGVIGKAFSMGKEVGKK
jgi:flavin reductase (DIM6/NTAB) family NADH-FMN oxidoreductase RutF